MNKENWETEKAMDWAIMQTAIGLEGLEQYAPKKEKPYLKAVLNLIARKPQEFRERGYVVGDVMFVDHERDKRGNVVKVRATFDKKEFADYYAKMQKEKMK
jgi:hypothetical protein